MKNLDQAVLKEWVDLDLDGELTSQEQHQLEQQVTAQPELDLERRQLIELHSMFGEAKVEVRPDFASGVMDALPVAAWEKSTTSGRVPVWTLPAAMVAVLALASSWILSASLSGSHLVETGSMLVDLVKTSVLAGSGMLFATWRGVGFGVEEMVADSTLNLAAFGVMVLCLNLLLVSFLRRRRPAAVTSETSND